MNSELENAKNAGREAKRNGQPETDNPYPAPGTPWKPGHPSRGFYENWKSGWNEGTEDES